MSAQTQNIDISIVTAVRDEEKVAPELVRRLVAVLEKLGKSFEIIFVTDFNRDNTLGALRDLAQRDARVKYIKLTRSYGQLVATLAGLHHSSGQVVVMMDGDLEDLPEDIPALLAKLEEGYDIAYGIRESKDDTAVRNFYSAIFNRVWNWLSDTPVGFNTNNFRAMRRRVLDELFKYQEQEPALNGLMSLIGYPSAGVPVTSALRYAGKTKYSFSRMVNLAISILLSFSTKPIRVISLLGMLISALSFIFLIGVVIYGLNPNYKGVGFMTVAALVTFFGGVQLFAIGIIGEYIGRTFVESKKRPLYTIEESTGFS